MKIVGILNLLMIMLLLVGCDNNNSSKENDDVLILPKEQPKPEHHSTSERTDSPSNPNNDESEKVEGLHNFTYPLISSNNNRKNQLFDKLITSCEESGGFWVSPKLECQCPSNMNGMYTVLDLDAKKCKVLSASVNNMMQETCVAEGYFQRFLQGGVQSLNECLMDGTNMFFQKDKNFNVNVTQMDMEIFDEFSMNVGNDLAELLDKNQGMIFSKSWAPFQKSNYLSVKIGENYKTLKLDDNEIHSILNPLIELGEDATLIFSKLIVTDNVKSLPYLLGKTISSNNIDEIYPKARADSKFFKLDSLWREMNKNYIEFDDGYAIHGLGCQDLCRIYSTVIDNEEMSAIWERFYHKGTIIHERITLIDKKTEDKQILVYGLNSKPLYYVDINTKIENDSIQKSATIFDYKFKKIVSKSYDRTSPYKDSLLAVKELPTVDSLQPGQGLVLCELINPTENDRLFVGKSGFDLNQKIGSLYGWENETYFNTSKFLHGLTLNEFTSYGSESPQLHGKNVQGVALEQYPDLYSTPAGLCLNEDSALSAIAKSDAVNTEIHLQKIKVVNMSLLLANQGGVGCQDRIDKLLGDSKEKLLLVIGAGNDGKKDPDACPQSLKGFQSIIVAGAKNADTTFPFLWNHSNYGADFADLATDYKTSSGKEGTSFSAPRVAAVATQIAQSHPYLTPEDIRLSILLSVYIPRNSSLMVRTGGVLRAEKALQLAKCFHENSIFGRKNGENHKPFTETQSEECLKKVDGFNSISAKKQIEILSRKSLIFNKGV